MFPMYCGEHRIVGRGGRLNLTELFAASSPSIVAFISKLTTTRTGVPPHFPPIFGTGFFIDASGFAVTNLHIVELFDNISKHPKTGESGLAAILFLPGEDYNSWQMLLVDVRAWGGISEFSSSDKWFGQTVPDIAFAQLGVRDVQPLRLATEDFYLKIGMNIATIGYPMGTMPLTALGKLNQVTPFLRHGVVSGVFPFPTAKPHGFPARQSSAPEGRRRYLSAAARAKLSRLLKQRWAQGKMGRRTKASKPERKMSAAGRKRIAEAAKRRWADWRRMQKKIVAKAA